MSNPVFGYTIDILDFMKKIIKRWSGYSISKDWIWHLSPLNNCPFMLHLFIQNGPSKSSYILRYSVDFLSYLNKNILLK